jgi:hypothetical protein
MSSAAHPHLDGEALRDAVRAAARCRATRLHGMELIPGDPTKRPWTGSLLTYRCEICGTIRYDTVMRMTGVLISRSYDPPDWYIAANETKEEPSWWRAKWWESIDDSLFLDAEPPKRVTNIASKRGARKRTA